jgi:hypothetical protein
VRWHPIVLTTLLVTALATAGPATPHPARVAATDTLASPVVVPDWTGYSMDFFPLVPAPVSQPVLTTADVNDAHALFLADPFLMHVASTWYMFFEATTPIGKIGLATSTDGLHWQYQHLVLAEPFQLSFPNVFQVDGTYYMTPETTARNAVRLYKATNFPDGWTHVADLVSGRPYADPSIFRYHERWWMFVGNGSSDSCFVFSSATLDSGWTAHPYSPIVAGNRGRARPAGRGVVLANDRLFRLTQNDTPTYGRAARVFQVDVLTTTNYQEHEIAASPIVQASGTGWNSNGMHTCDPWWDGDHWLAAVDGYNGSTWSIGIYTSPTIAGVPLGDAAPGAARLQGSPNPCRGVVHITGEFPAWRAASAGRLTIFDVRGRCLVSRAVPWRAGGSVDCRWDGTDGSGQRVPAGVYSCTIESNGHTATTRIVVAR